MVISRRMVVFGFGILICIFLLKATEANDESNPSKCIHSVKGEGNSHHAHELCIDHEDNEIPDADDFDDTFKVVENVAISL